MISLPDDTHDRAIESAGRRWIAALQAAIQAQRLYPAGNDATARSIEDVAHAAAVLVDAEGYAELMVREGFFFVNDTRVRFDFAQYGIFSGVALALSRHGLGGIRVSGPSAIAEWRATVAILGTDPVENASAEGAHRRLRSACADGSIELIPALHGISAAGSGEKSDDPEASAYAAARACYHSASTATREAFNDVRLGRAVGVRRLRRAVLSLVDRVTQHEHSILAMTCLKEYDEYTHQHSLNVCVLSLLIGRRLGLTRQRLLDLGMGALLHDVGKMRVPGDVIRKPGRLDEEEWGLIRKHPLDGMLAIHDMAALGGTAERAMLIAYEHHMELDLSGYPRCERARRLLLFSRIVAVADAFDAGTGHRSYQPHPPPPDEVIRSLRETRESGCDPLIVKALINVTGFYPVGTLVILDTYEMGIVRRRNPDPRQPHRPIVTLVTDPTGIHYAVPVSVDLADEGRPGIARRTIVKTANPEKYGIRASDYVTV